MRILTDPAVGQLLEDLKEYEKKHPADADGAALIRVTRRMYEKAVKIPSDFILRVLTNISPTRIRCG